MAMLASSLMIAGTLGIAAGSAASPAEAPDGDPLAAGDEVVSPAAVPQCRAYVTNRESGTLLTINTATNDGATLVPLGTTLETGGPDQLAVSPDGAIVYVVDVDLDFVYVVEAGLDEVVDTITDLDLNPFGVAFAPDRGLAYITNGSSFTVSLIRTTNHSRLGTITLDSFPGAVAFSPNGTPAYVTLPEIDKVAVINTYAVGVTATIDVGDSPQRVAFSPDGAFAYVANFGDGTVSVINTTSNTVTRTISVGGLLSGLAVNPDGSTVYVTKVNDNKVSVINTSTNTVTGTIDVGNGPVGVAFSPGGATAYVVNRFGGSVSVIDTAAGVVSDTIEEVGLDPREVAFGPCSAPTKPAAPGVAVSGAGSVRATVARGSGGNAPTSFNVTADPGVRSCEVSGESGSCVVSGLDERTVYRVSAVARNADRSAPSDVSVSVTPGSGDATRAANQFRDVLAKSFYARGVDLLFQHGITTGKGSPDVFAPNEVVTRAQMATFLWRMSGEPRASACSFEDQLDIPTSARVATCWLEDNGYTTEDRFRPGDPVTRAQMAAFLFRIWGPDGGVYRESCEFRDEGKIPSWALGATCWMKDNNITTGLGTTGNYGPRDGVTRGQMAAFLYRLGGYIENRWLVILE
jgi:YVTN family beta-propeller protein